jgi:hypothetical protein
MSKERDSKCCLKERCRDYKAACVDDGTISPRYLWICNSSVAEMNALKHTWNESVVVPFSTTTTPSFEPR